MGLLIESRENFLDLVIILHLFSLSFLLSLLSPIITCDIYLAIYNKTRLTGLNIRTTTTCSEKHVGLRRVSFSLLTYWASYSFFILTSSSFCSVSRADLFNNSSSDEGQEPNEDLTNLEEISGGFAYDIVDIAKEEEKEEETGEESTDPDEKKSNGTELFPMFSTDPTVCNDSKSSGGLVKVNLAENTLSADLIDDAFEKAIHEQHRPKSYYFANIDDDTMNRIQLCAVSGESIIDRFRKTLVSHTTNSYRLIDLASYNKKVDEELKIEKLRLEKKHKSRPGKKKRIAKIKAKAIKEERRKYALKLKKKQIVAKSAFRNRRDIAQRSHNTFNRQFTTGKRAKRPRTRGGRKHKKSMKTQQVRFRTE